MKMKTKISTIVLALTALVFNVQADSSTLPAPMPQFMNKEQLVKWNAEQAATYKPVATEEEPPLMFFTGKPYIPDAGGYVYKYRTYNPEMLRWTSADPSGFPDSPNNYIAPANPVGSFDPNGLDVESAYSSNVDVKPNQFSASSAALAILTGNSATLVQQGVQQAIQIAWSVCAKGTATYNTNTGTWGNIQPFDIEGGDNSRTTKVGITGTLSNVGFVGFYQLTVTLGYSGTPRTVGTPTPYSPGNPAHITLTDDLVANITETVSGTGNPGPILEYSHSYTVDLPDPQLTIYE